MNLPVEPADLLLKKIQRLENQMQAIIYLTKAALSLIKRMSQGERIPVEQIESLEKAMDTLNPGNRR